MGKWTGPLLPVLVDEVAVDVGNRTNNWGYYFVSCGKQQSFSACFLCGSSFVAEVYFEKKGVTVTIATIAIYKLCFLKNAYLSTTGKSEGVQTVVITVDRTVYTRVYSILQMLFP